MDKEFLAELEKNLGLVEANANLMPPSPAPSTSTNSQQQQNGAVAKAVPALLPPPQSSGRNGNRRSMTNIQTQPQPPQNGIKRESSVPRNSPQQLVDGSQLRVVLPQESPVKKDSKTAFVKPFLSPNSKQQVQMGNVAAARGNWKPLTVGPNRDLSKDFLTEQRRQLAEIERLRGMGASGGARNARSQSVMPPSGAERPTNHLEVNKMAQVQ